MNRDIVGRWIVTTEVRVPSQDIRGRRFDGNSVSGTGFPSCKYRTVCSALFSILQCSYTLMCRLGIVEWAR